MGEGGGRGGRETKTDERQRREESKAERVRQRGKQTKGKNTVNLMERGGKVRREREEKEKISF